MQDVAESLITRVIPSNLLHKVGPTGGMRRRIQLLETEQIHRGLGTLTMDIMILLLPHLSVAQVANLSISSKAFYTALITERGEEIGLSWASCYASRFGCRDACPRSQREWRQLYFMRSSLELSLRFSTQEYLHYLENRLKRSKIREGGNPSVNNYPHCSIEDDVFLGKVLRPSRIYNSARELMQRGRDFLNLLPQGYDAYLVAVTCGYTTRTVQSIIAFYFPHSASPLILYTRGPGIQVELSTSLKYAVERMGVCSSTWENPWVKMMRLHCQKFLSSREGNSFVLPGVFSDNDIIYRLMEEKNEEGIANFSHGAEWYFLSTVEFTPYRHMSKIRLEPYTEGVELPVRPLRGTSTSKSVNMAVWKNFYRLTGPLQDIHGGSMSPLEAARLGLGHNASRMSSIIKRIETEIEESDVEKALNDDNFELMKTLLHKNSLFALSANSGPSLSGSEDMQTSKTPPLIDVNQPVASDDTLLCRAITNGNLRIVQLLLEEKANPNRPSGRGLPLQIAVGLVNSEEMAKILVEAGADPFLRCTADRKLAARASKLRRKRGSLSRRSRMSAKGVNRKKLASGRQARKSITASRRGALLPTAFAEALRLNWAETAKRWAIAKLQVEELYGSSAAEMCAPYTSKDCSHLVPSTLLFGETDTLSSAGLFGGGTSSSSEVVVPLSFSGMGGNLFNSREAEDMLAPSNVNDRKCAKGKKKKAKLAKKTTAGGDETPFKSDAVTPASREKPKRESMLGRKGGEEGEPMDTSESIHAAFLSLAEADKEARHILVHCGDRCFEDDQLLNLLVYRLGADVNALVPRETGGPAPLKTLLLHCIEENRPNFVVDALIRKGADVNRASGRKGDTPLFAAVESWEPSCDSGLAYTQYRNKEGECTSHSTKSYTVSALIRQMALENLEELVVMLLRARADVNARRHNSKDDTPLLVHAISCQSPVVRLLVSQGANLTGEVDETLEEEKGKEKVGQAPSAKREKGHTLMSLVNVLSPVPSAAFLREVFGSCCSMDPTFTEKQRDTIRMFDESKDDTGLLLWLMEHTEIEHVHFVPKTYVKREKEGDGREETKMQDTQTKAKKTGKVEEMHTENNNEVERFITEASRLLASNATKVRRLFVHQVDDMRYVKAILSSLETNVLLERLFLQCKDITREHYELLDQALAHNTTIEVVNIGNTLVRPLSKREMFRYSVVKEGFADDHPAGEELRDRITQKLMMNACMHQLQTQAYRAYLRTARTDRPLRFFDPSRGGTLPLNARKRLEQLLTRNRHISAAIYQKRPEVMEQLTTTNEKKLAAAVTKF